MSIPVCRECKACRNLTALATVLQGMEDRPTLDYWLTRYVCRKVDTPPTIHLVGRAAVSGGRQLRAEGGARLTAYATRLSEGDVGALRDVVLEVRPKDDHPLTWQFIHDGGFIVTLGKSNADSDLGQQYANAEYYFQTKQYEKSLEVVNGVIDGNPKSNEFLAFKGTLLAAMARNSQALLVLDKAIKNDPRSGKALYARGRIRFESGDIRLALADMDALLAVYPHHAGGLFWRTRALCALGRPAEARAILIDFLHTQVDRGWSLQEATDVCLRLSARDGYADIVKILLDLARSP